MAKINYDKVKEVNKSVAKTKNKEFDLIVVVINRGFSDYIVDAARDAGASGGTIINGRGTGVHEIMKKICEASNLNDEGRGLCFSMPVSDIAGINHLINKNKKKK